jgi:putative transposase
VVRLLPMSDREKEVEILVPRHQLTVLQRQLAEPAFTPADRFLLAGLLHHLPMDKLRQLQLLVRPDTCRCRKLGHPMRPGSIRAGDRRAGIVV